MAGLSKIEKYLIDLNISYEILGENSFCVSNEESALNGLLILVDEPLVVIRLKLMNLPKNNKEKFYAELLKLNACEMLHGAYGIDENDVIIVDTLEYESMDKSEFEASLDAIELAVNDHYKVLSSYR